MPHTSEKLRENLARMEALTQRLVAAFGAAGPINPALEGPGVPLFAAAGTAFLKEFNENPTRLFAAQAAYWQQSMTYYMDASRAFAEGRTVLENRADDHVGGGPKDPRFLNPLWEKHPYFSLVKRQYDLSVTAIEQALACLDGLNAAERDRLSYFTRQLIDMMAPPNFLATNPDALERAVETEGESLVRGLENLVRDVEENDGRLLVTLADRDAFSVGKNIAVSDGGVVFRNHLFELIQYAPRTDTVHRNPIVIFPPWINKFYILDLKPANSLIKFMLDQGFTVFLVSWKNPNAEYANVGLDDYISDGFLTAIAQVKQISGQASVNALGYCIAGTALAMTLALMAQRKDTSVASATFLTTLTDFSDQGEFAPFLQEDFLSGIEAQIAQDGILSSYFLARTFSFLRANDLIYGPAIRSYLMGDPPPAFDLLYWNGDGTNLPGRMARDYLRGLYSANRFATTGYPLLGTVVTPDQVKVPLMAIACETDHIAPWRASFTGIAEFGSQDKTFVLSESGHVAGIVNPPSKRKYGHFTSPGTLTNSETWKSAAHRNDGSWWPLWADWLAQHSGERGPVPELGGGQNPILGPAPGEYVREPAARPRPTVKPVHA